MQDQVPQKFSVFKGLLNVLWNKAYVISVDIAWYQSFLKHALSKQDFIYFQII